MSGNNATPIWDVGGAFLAAVSGVIVALVGQYLQVRHENENLRRLYRSAHRLLGLEVVNNRASLEAFWRAINGLDAEQHRDSTEHLAAMLSGGLLGYELPQWSFSRWERLEAETFPAFGEKELAGIDLMNRALQSITELYKSLSTLTAEDKADLAKNMGGRFWANDLARDRYPTYNKLADAVAQVLGVPSPIG